MNHHFPLKISLITLIALFPTHHTHASPWKWLAIGTGIAWGTTAICETIKDCNKRSCDREDRDLVATFSHQIYSIADSYQYLVELTQKTNSQRTKEDFASYFMKSKQEFNSTIKSLKEDITALDDSISRVENAVRQWHTNPDRDELRIAAREELRKARELYSDLLTTRNRLENVENFVNLYSTLNSIEPYNNPHDLYPLVNEAEYLSQVCKRLSNMLSALEYDGNKTVEDERLTEKGYEKLAQIKAKQGSLMRDPAYQKELQLKRQDELNQEILATNKRLAQAEEEKARAERDRARAEEQKASAMREQNRIASEANWIKERELYETKNKLDRIERRVRELQAEHDKDSIIIQLRTLFD